MNLSCPAAGCSIGTILLTASRSARARCCRCGASQRPQRRAATSPRSPGTLPIQVRSPVRLPEHSRSGPVAATFTGLVCDAGPSVIPSVELSMMVRRITCELSCCGCADLFAAGYGSFDAQRQGAGAVVCFSLKDPSTPESQHQTSSGAALLAALYIHSRTRLHEPPHQLSSALCQCQR